MSNVGIIGYGVVGSALGEVMNLHGHHVKFHDPAKVGSIPLKELVPFSEYIFLCLPTPTDFKVEKIDVSILDKVMEEITPMTNKTNKVIVIKSTVLPGTTLRYQRMYLDSTIAFNPEFLTEAKPVADLKNPDRIVIGAFDEVTKKRLKEFYQASYTRAIDIPIFTCDPTEAELVKYMANTFLAMKVIFANEMSDIAEYLGCNYSEVMKMVGADPRIGISHLKVTEKRGFGGMCFPKDIVALIGFCEEQGLDCTILKMVWLKNRMIREVKEWE